MGRSLRHERQVLNADEVALVAATHHPALAALPDKELAELRKHVRERRDRAGQIAARQRREIRGKADRPRGARPVTEDLGSRAKRDVLAAAMKRLNGEAARREAKAARGAMKDSVARALELRRKREATAAAPRFRPDRERRHARQGRQPLVSAQPRQTGRSESVHEEYAGQARQQVGVFV